jgi:hypothetical protein
MDKSDIGLDIINAKWPLADEVGREQILWEIKQQGLSIGDAVFALARSKFLSLGDAKEYVSASPAWQREVENSRELQEIAWQVLEDFTASQQR